MVTVLVVVTVALTTMVSEKAYLQVDSSSDIEFQVWDDTSIIY